MAKEYIEREALIEVINHFTNKSIRESNISSFSKYFYEMGRDHVIDYIKLMPAADVAEVVRCKDCKHLTVHNSPTLYAYCEKTKYRFEPFQTDTRTHFCSYGERKENE